MSRLPSSPASPLQSSSFQVSRKKEKIYTFISLHSLYTKYFEHPVSLLAWIWILLAEKGQIYIQKKLEIMLGYDLYLKMLMWQMMTKLAPFTDSSSSHILLSCRVREMKHVVTIPDQSWVFLLSSSLTTLASQLVINHSLGTLLT